jgi:hypothetical protein
MPKGACPRATRQRHRHGVKIMLALLSRRSCVLIQGFGLRRFVLSVSALLAVVLSADAVLAQDFIRDDRQVARTWALHRIAVIQAAAGDVQGAKNTIAQIGDPEYVSGPSEVTSVWFCNGMAIYDHPPAPINRVGYGWRGSQYFRDRSPDRVPAEVPRGLPANYLAADPRHGAVVDFRDEYDSYGTRVTARRYADGSLVIETPHSTKNKR